jgi:hypothetical protein
MDPARRIAELETRLAELGAELADLRTNGHAQSTGRRQALRLAGAALGAGVVGAIAGRTPVAADIGLATNSTLTFTDEVRMSYTGSTAGEHAFQVSSGTAASNVTSWPAAIAGVSFSGSTQPHGVFGSAGEPFGAGVLGYATDDDGYGVRGLAVNGVGVSASSPGGVGLDVTGNLALRAVSPDGNGATVTAQSDGFAAVVATSNGGPDSTGVFSESSGSSFLAVSGKHGLEVLGATRASLKLDDVLPGDVAKVAPPQRTDVHRRGELDCVGGDLWWCVEGGTPGRWVKLAGTATGGAFHPVTPFRAYDSRVALPTPGTLAAGANRTVSVASARDLDTGAVSTADVVPAGARAVSCNVTVVNTLNGGFVTVNPGGVTTVGAASVNWSESGQVLNNGIIAAIDPATRTVTLVCGAGQADVVLDITGYWR